MSRTDAEIEPKSAEPVVLGQFRFFPESRDLRDPSGSSVTLRSQSAGVLAYLAEHTNELVTKDALIEAVWGDTFVTDDSLVQCIGDIRRALGDDQRKIVQTFPRKGYKLVVEGGAPAMPRRRWLPALGAAIVAVLIAVAAWINFDQPGPTHPKGDKPRIAVLPFDDFSAGADKGFLSDAIAEGIITELARNSLISVIARNSSFRYRGNKTDVRQIGEDLGVHYLLEGSQQKNGDALKVTVQLIDAAGGAHLWAHSYDQQIGDLFTVQDAIIKTVADRIGVQIERPVPGADPDKVTALQLYLQAEALARQDFNVDVHGKMMALYRQAMEIDPNAQYGYIGLAYAYRSAAIFGWLDLSEDDARARGFEMIDKALEIAPDDAEAHFVHGRLLIDAGEPDKAMAAFDRAIAINPSNSDYLIASTDVLLYTGQPQEAIARLEQARGIDPFVGHRFHWQMAWALWEIDDCEGALASMLRMSTQRRSAQRMMAGIYACLGEVEKAQAAYRTFYAEAREPTVSEQREEWKDIWTGQGSLERWLDHMRIAGMQD